jgi:hypothetical protein
MLETWKHRVFGLEVRNADIPGADRFVFVDMRLSQTPVGFSARHLTEATKPFKMKEELKLEWIRRLRSGEYAQTQSALHIIFKFGELAEAYCCLGVYCELRELPKVEIPSVNPNEVRFGYGINRERLYLPREIEHEVGGNAYQTALAACNDSKWTFDEIATLLEVAF